MRSPLSALVLLACCLTAAGCAKKKKEPPPPTPTVTVSQPMVRSIVDWDDFVGHFEAVDTVDVRPRITGYLQSIGFRDGQVVRKGQVLFVIDPRPAEAALAQARAQVARSQATLANARVELTRAQTLYAGRATSQQDVQTRLTTQQTAAADLAAAQASAQTAALTLSYTRVTAPLTGRVSDRKAAVGNLVTADTTVLTSIVSVDPIRFLFVGSESAYLKYQKENETGSRRSSRYAANPVEIQVQGEKAYRWKGRMDFVDNQVDPSSGTIRGRAVIPNPDAYLTPGLYGKLRLLGSGPYDALLVPDTSVTTDQSRQIAYVVGKDSKVAAKVIQPGQLVDGLRVIRSGLNRDDRVVIDGIGAAKPGVQVKTKPGQIVAPDPGSSPEPSPPGGEKPKPVVKSETKTRTVHRRVHHAG